MSTKRLFIRGIASSWVVQVSTIALAFLITPLIVRGLGTERYGIWALCQSMLSYFAVIGFRGAAAKYFAEFEARGDRMGVARVGMASLIANSLLGGLALIGSGIIALVFPYAIDLGSVDPTEARLVIILTGLAFGARFIGVTFRAQLDAAFQISARNVVEFSGAFLQTISCGILAWYGYGLVSLAVATLVVRILEFFGFYFYSHRYVAPFRFELALAERAMIKNLAVFTFAQVFIALAKRTTVYVGGLIVAFFHGPAVAAYYMLAEGLLSRADGVTTPVASTLMPLASRLEAQDRQDDMRHMLVLSSRVMMVFGLIITISVAVMGKTLLRVWLGPEFVVPTYAPLFILSVAFLVRISRKGLYSILVGMGRNYLLSRLAMLEALITVSFGAALTWQFGAVGMASATVLAQLLTVSLLLPLYAKRELGLHEGRFTFTVLAPSVVATLPSLALAFLFEHYLPADRLLVLIAEGAVVAAAGMLTGLFVCIDANMRSEVVRSFLPGGKKKKRNGQRKKRVMPEIATENNQAESV